MVREEVIGLEPRFYDRAQAKFAWAVSDAGYAISEAVTGPDKVEAVLSWAPESDLHKAQWTFPLEGDPPVLNFDLRKKRGRGRQVSNPVREAAFWQFGRLDRSDMTQILIFASEFGMLTRGLGTAIPTKDAAQFRTIQDLLPFMREPLSLWRQEVADMRNFAQALEVSWYLAHQHERLDGETRKSGQAAHEAMENDLVVSPEGQISCFGKMIRASGDQLSQAGGIVTLDDGSQATVDFLDPEETGDLDHQLIATIAAGAFVNEKLQKYPVFTTMGLEVRDGVGRKKAVTARSRMWQCPSSLLSAMWYQAALALSGERRYKRCPICGRWEDVTDRRPNWKRHQQCQKDLDNKRRRAKTE